MSGEAQLIMVVGMSLVTFLVRYPILALVGRLNLSEGMLRALKYVPPSVLTAIIVPALLLPNGTFDLRPQNSFLVAGVICAFVAWRTRNLLLTIVLGMAALWGYRLVLSVLGVA